MKPNSIRLSGVAFVLACLSWSISAQAQITNFSQDVASSIDLGLEYAAQQGWFTNGCPDAAHGDGTGLITIALLEKRQDANQNALSQGYEFANAVDQARMDRSYHPHHQPRSGLQSIRSAYQDGADLMALSLYWRTNGPDQAGHSPIHTLFDRIAQNQGAHGYWCYNNGGCQGNSSTTQLVMAGLAAARGVFLDDNDAARSASLEQLTLNTRNAYAANGQAEAAPLSVQERGHGYRVGQANSLQQTASGIWGSWPVVPL